MAWLALVPAALVSTEVAVRTTGSPNHGTTEKRPHVGHVVANLPAQLEWYGFEVHAMHLSTLTLGVPSPATLALAAAACVSAGCTGS